MKFIIIGLGSMGKRRARCLQMMGYDAIFGFDLNVERVKDAINQNIQAENNLHALPLGDVDAIFICTPPDTHDAYIELALEYRKPCFIEASVVLGRLEEMKKVSEERNVLILPSCTMLFHPAIKAIKSIVSAQQYGKVTNFSYHCGQYLPDWHPWEKVSDFYVSNPLTGGCREIVPFELTWLVDFFGLPKQGVALFGSTMDVGADISDSYAISLQFEECFGTLLVDVTSRYGIRKLVLNFEHAQLQWSWDANLIKLYDAKKKEWEDILVNISSNEVDGYNKNIHEQMYVDEIASFLSAIQGNVNFPNNLEKDIKILNLLRKLEENGGAKNVLS